MAIGRSFAEALQKGLRSMETGYSGLDAIDPPGDGGRDAFRAALSQPRPDRLMMAAQALRAGLSIEDIHACQPVRPVVPARTRPHRGRRTRRHRLRPAHRRLCAAAAEGARLLRPAARGADLPARNRRRAAARQVAGVHPVYKRIDTCAGEFASATPYMYSTYEGGFGTPACEPDPTARQKIVILGGGPNRIGQGIEFDYCCVHAAYALREAGFETVMVNCNPETVSTDYDTSDRLYFEPLTAEDVIALVRKEQSNGTVLGCIVQYGGQTPAKAVPRAGGRRHPHPRHLRRRDRHGGGPRALPGPAATARPAPAARTASPAPPEEAEAIAIRVGYPVVLRPSYVLGGRGMEIVHDRAGLQRYIREAVRVSGDNPVLVDHYLNDAIEVDVDCIADGHTVYVAGVMEHIEEAGIHSGDSACSLPPYSPVPRHHHRAEGPDRGDGQGARRGRADERAVRDQGRRDLRAGGQSRGPAAPCRSLPRPPASPSPRSAPASWLAPGWPSSSWTTRPSPPTSR